MGKFDSFQDIDAWKKARLFNKNIYQTTEDGKFAKDFNLTRQIRRASISVSSNIAEGFERQAEKEFIQFLYIAKGSAGEIRSQLYLALDLEYISEGDFKRLKKDIVEVSKMIGGLIKYLKGRRLNLRIFSFNF